MKPPTQSKLSWPIWLTASLGLNILLVVLIVWATRGLASAPRQTQPVAPVRAAGVLDSAPPAPTSVITKEVTTPFHWSEVESTDYQQYFTNLQAIGCPDQRIRDIIIADVDALFAARARDYVTPLQSQFWSLVSRPSELEKTMAGHQKFLDTLDQERDEIFRTLFNDSNPHRQSRQIQRDSRSKARQDSIVDFLEPTQRAAVEALQAELNLAVANIKSPESLTNRDDIRRHRDTQQRELKTACDQKLRALLSPEEFEEYSLRTSPAASLRYRLARMTVSETEARRLAQANAAKLEAESQLDQKDPTAKVARAELEQRTQEQIKIILGPERFAEYQRVTDGRYGETARIIDRLQLPEQTAINIYQARLEAEKIAARLRADTSASVEERNAALIVIRTEAESSVRGLLGESAFKEYQNHAGAWFYGLVEPAK